MVQRTNDNHFLPQAYLKPWSVDGKRVWGYRTLVSRESVPLWTRRSIRGTGFQRHLYTEISHGGESDDFERWIEADYETPAQGAIAKVLRGEALSAVDWERLAMLLAAQDVRTPTSYLESMDRWGKEMPELLSSTLKESVERLERASMDELTRASGGDGEPDFFKGVFRIRVENPADERADGKIQAEVVLGRHFWLQSQRHLLTHTAKVLRSHKWSIAEPKAGNTWTTSDHPVVRLNYYEPGKYDLKAGWGSRGSELMMPLSPRHLLYTQVEHERPDRFVFSAYQTQEVQRILAERAHRWIFAQSPFDRVTWLRPRHVSAEAFKAEQEEWRQWHKKQIAAEVAE